MKELASLERGVFIPAMIAQPAPLSPLDGEAVAGLWLTLVESSDSID